MIASDLRSSGNFGLHFDVLPEIQPLKLQVANEKLLTLDCLRLDKIHPFVSGNKWYKLKHHILEAQEAGKSALLSFGGGYSNHLHALAFVGNQLQFKTIGIVRGEPSEALNPTLQDCVDWGMELHWVDRQEYRKISSQESIHSYADRYYDAWVIPEGGAGRQGILGIQSLFNSLHHAGLMNYDLIACAVGSGATLAGIIQANVGNAQCVGFSALKGAHDLEVRVERQLAAAKRINSWRICHDYHFGGFAKINARLTSFISDMHTRHDFLLDPIYTGKMMYGLAEYLHQGRIKAGARVLAVHTGGLQGWRGFGEGYQHFVPAR
jgi:1-aminocyclopropane-1-carboxylate deaminase/D-cysteine desulfhydrase